MAIPDPKKKQKIYDMDFSDPDCHVALVREGANGIKQPLLVKAINGSTEYLSKLFDKAPVGGVTILSETEEMVAIAPSTKEGTPFLEMPLEEVLTIFLGVWSEDAEAIVRAITMKGDELGDETIKRLGKALKEFDSTNSGASDDALEETIVNGDDIMSDENIAPEADQELVTKAAKLEGELEEARLALKALQDAEAARVLKEYKDVATKLEVLGIKEEDAAVLKAVSEIEGGEAVIKALKDAVETINKAAVLDETGSSHSDEGVNAATKLESKAAELQKADKSLTKEKAFVLACEQNPDLLA